jgi:uncharacterized protein YbjT (DUF2867 family)
MMRNVVVAGGTGEVGRRLLMRMANRPDLVVRVPVRRPGLPVRAPNLHEVPFDFEDEAACRMLFADPCDVLLLTLGTTRVRAGSDAAFLRVDRDIPLRLIRTLAAACPEARVGLVSSVGADRPRGLYLGAKAEVEAALVPSSLAHVVVRPSFLVSDRAEFRLGETLALRLLAPSWLVLGRSLFPRSAGWWRWAPVHVREVADTLLEATLALEPGQRRVLEGLDLHPGSVSNWGKI